MAELLGTSGNKAIALLFPEYGGVTLLLGDHVPEVVAAAARTFSVGRVRIFLKSSVGWSTAQGTAYADRLLPSPGENQLIMGVHQQTELVTCRFSPHCMQQVEMDWNHALCARGKCVLLE
jgi:hypothetical protein